MNAAPEPEFAIMRDEQVAAMKGDAHLSALSIEWFLRATDHGYSYHFDVLGRPIIQFPQDIVAINEIIWKVRPEVVIETGIARGGSVVNTAAQLALLDLSETKPGTPLAAKRKVLAIDIEIRRENRAALDDHFLSPWFDLIEGSSTAEETVRLIQSRIPRNSAVLVMLDSNHTSTHVLDELNAYAPLVTPGSYCVVYDTVIEDMPQGYFADRPWDVGDNPATAVKSFLQDRTDFVVDESITDKLLVSVAPRGYLRRIDASARQ